MSADANPLTGNLLVSFDPSYEVGAIAEIIGHAATVVASTNDVGASSGRSAIAMKKGSWKARVSETLRSLHEQTVSKKEPEHLPWHTMDWEQVVARNGSRPDTGLTAATAKKRLQLYGLNMLPESLPRSQLAMLFDQLSSTPILLLMAAAATSILTGGLADAIVILGVVGLNTAIGYVTESQSERTIHSLKSNIRPSAVVIRESKPQQIPATQVAVGDILVLGPGTYVAADSRLVTADRLSVDESALTGESVPVTKITEKMDGATTSSATAATWSTWEPL